MRRIAFYAPLKSPRHPVPSGDRRMARLLMAALGEAGYSVDLASEFRSLDGTGREQVQDNILAQASLEADLLIRRLAEDPPGLWFTYHPYYKAPDLIGPRLATTLGIPYVVAEASHAPRRLVGPWSRFAARTADAIRRADRVFVMSNRDGPMLGQLVGPASWTLETLHPFVDPGPDPIIRVSPSGPTRLITVAMMRPGDKLASYSVLANTLETLEDDRDWTLDIVGDGPERAAVEALFSGLGARVRFRGQIDDSRQLRAELEAADLFVWPGVGEAYGMAYLEAQSAGTPVAAIGHLGVSTVVADGEGGRLSDPAHDTGYRTLLTGLLEEPDQLGPMGRRARARVIRDHSLKAAARQLRRSLDGLFDRGDLFDRGATRGSRLS